MPFKVIYIFWLIFVFASPNAAIGQQYYTSAEGRANIHFIVEGEFHTASTNSVEIIYNLRKETIWLTFQVASFRTGNKKLDKKLFKKNPSHFVVRGDLRSKNIVSAGFDFFQFSFIGRIFNDHNTGPVSASGRFIFSPENEDKGYEFTLSSGIEKKWFGEKFASISGYPVVNIHVITTILKPVVTTSGKGS